MPPTEWALALLAYVLLLAVVGLLLIRHQFKRWDEGDDASEPDDLNEFIEETTEAIELPKLYTRPEIQPCPFCGCGANLPVRVKGRLIRIFNWKVLCTGCGAIGPVAGWNDRPRRLELATRDMRNRLHDKMVADELRLTQLALREVNALDEPTPAPLRRPSTR